MGQEEISSCDLERLLDHNKIGMLIDLREEEEFLSGHIYGAVNIPLCKILKMEFPCDYGENGKIVVYCSHGRNSLFVCRMLREKGICAMHLKGGIKNYCGKYFVKV